MHMGSCASANTDADINFQLSPSTQDHLHQTPGLRRFRRLPALALSRPSMHEIYEQLPWSFISTCSGATISSRQRWHSGYEEGWGQPDTCTSKTWADLKKQEPYDTHSSASLACSTWKLPSKVIPKEARHNATRPLTFSQGFSTFGFS